MVYLFLADGFEIIEALAPVDMLRRAKIDVKTVGVSEKCIKSSCGVEVACDIEISELDLSDAVAVILPGGMPGTLNLEECSSVQGAVDYAVENSLLIGAICAAPSILGHKGLLSGKEAIVFPGYEDDLLGARLSNDYVVQDGNIITAKGAGVATEFGLKIVEYLTDKAIADEIKGKIQCR